ncbi:hypothetical protein BZG36_05007 [Bifiguratus adelaidae]|uniref:Uncharacterized protein n=1 Tax=Bifiguratus adelaidae TaxID=1938954 RepID=A0A261XU91_9FUNG|nr:hypothetical protein BZG36_05007 [Bifiguratus adelaidae]
MAFKWFKRGSPPPVPEACQELPQNTANPFSRLVFEWITPVLTTGYQRPLEKEDLYVLDDARLAHNMQARFQEQWDKRVAKGKKVSITRALNSTFGVMFWLGGLYGFIANVLQVTSPLLVNSILSFGQASYYGPNPPPVGLGYMYCVILYAMQCLSSLFNHHNFQNSMITGFSVRTVLITSLYRKSLRLSGKARMNYTTGKIVNLMSTDTTRIDFLCGYFHIIWTAPAMILIGLGILINQLGVSGLAGFGIMVLFVPANARVMSSLAKVRRKAVLVTDSRVKTTQEMLTGIRVIKFFAWEKSFIGKLASLRTKELGLIRRILVIRSGVNGVAMTIPIISSMLSFVTYVLTGHYLQAAIIFSSLTIFNIVRMPLFQLPMVIGAYVDARVSLSRIEEILDADELDPLAPIKEDSKYAISVEDGEFKWETLAPTEMPGRNDKKKFKGDSGGKGTATQKEKKSWKERISKKRKANTRAYSVDQERAQVHEKGAEGTESNEHPERSFLESKPSFLKNLNLKIPKGSLTAVIGTVGSGKSSLLSALVGEMKKVEGSVTFGGTVGYCPQTAWIQNATVKDNILFGLEYDEKRYQRVIKDCALTHDLSVLPEGDQTEIGERGINLSGGQKQRINLARAYYFNADIVLLDDPLSAVDAHVGRYLFENCICDALSSKTRVLVTHQLHVLPKVDYIIVMKDGSIAEEGTFAELMASGKEFSVLMNEYGGIDHADDEVTKNDEDIEEEAETKKEVLKVDLEKEKQGPSRSLMTQEERNTGAVEGRVYKSYFQATGGLWCVPVCLFTLALVQASNIMTSQWLSFWTVGAYGLTTTIYMVVYVCLGLSQAVFNFFSAFAFSILGNRATNKIHTATSESVFRAPMSFFDTTPIGRIMNRFSKDVDACDNLLSDSYRMFLNTFSAAISTFVLISIHFPVFLAPLAFLLVFYGFAAVYYRSTSRELKRLDSLLRSTLYAHFSETLSGLATIRAYRVQDRFIRNNEQYTDLENRAYYLSITVQRWLAIRLEFIANTLVLFSTIFAVVYRFNIQPATMGFVLSYTLSVTGSFNWCVRQFAEVENNMNSVERLYHYANQLEHEAPLEIPDHKPPKIWPSKGDITFRNLRIRYRDGLPDVLHGLNLDIAGGSKIGIVGRTGSGKSTIMIALFRLVEAAGGSINIDGLDISTIGLHDLRSRLAIIPQDPVLFHGTVRSNLDPFGVHEDQSLWDALGRANLKDYVASCEGGLDSEIAENGDNLSVGQRQLLCLSRAMLAQAKVVIMDEATASVDVKTDAILQKALRKDFKNCTLLTIAHRLNTIIDYDKVLVLDNGYVNEYASPHELLSSPDSTFSSMVDETGPANSELLRKLAKLAAEGAMDVNTLVRMTSYEEDVLEDGDELSSNATVNEDAAYALSEKSS